MAIAHCFGNPAIRFAVSTIRHHNGFHFLRPNAAAFRRVEYLVTRAFSSNQNEIGSLPDKPSICTADELHYVTLKNSDWRLALWRYNPSPQAPPRNHPLLLLSGVGTNAIGYDLSPGSSFARYMCGQGFDTWVLEVRGAGLSTKGSSRKEIERSAHAISGQMEVSAENVTNGTPHAHSQASLIPSTGGKSGITAVNEKQAGGTTTSDESRLVTKLAETFTRFSERLSSSPSESQSNYMFSRFFDQISRLVEGSYLVERFNELRGKFLSLLETRQNSGLASQIRDLTQKLVEMLDEGQRSVSPPLFNLQERLVTAVDDFQKQLDLIVNYDWDFDDYLEEDIPVVMEYIRAQCKPRDGRLLAIGHSMGGILLYAMLSHYSSKGRDPGFAAVVTLASSLDYTSSNSMLRLLLPLADPVQALNVPAIPLGALLSAAYPLSSRPPYVLSWINGLISAEDMMHPDLLKKLVLNNFCTIPVKLLLQLTTAFREGGLQNRNGKYFYKDHLHESNVPVLALAGDKDSICPPVAVHDTAKLFPEHLVTYKVFGEAGGPHYAHYDLVGGRMAAEQIYPCIIQFLSCHDSHAL